MSLPKKPCFLTDHFYFEEFCKPLPKEYSCKIIMISNQWLGRRRLLKVFSLVAMVTKIPHGTLLFEGM